MDHQWKHEIEMGTGSISWIMRIVVSQIPKIRRTLCGVPKITTPRRVNARRESARIAAEAAKQVYVALRACAHACKQGIRAAGFYLESCENRVFGWEAFFTVFLNEACFDTEADQKPGTRGFSGMSR